MTFKVWQITIKGAAKQYDLLGTIEASDIQAAFEQAKELHPDKLVRVSGGGMAIDLHPNYGPLRYWNVAE